MKRQENISVDAPQFLLIALPENTKSQIPKRKRRFRTTFKRSIVAMLLAVLAFSTGGIGAAPSQQAQAWPWNPVDAISGAVDFLCGYTPHWWPAIPTPWPGNGLLAEVIIPDNVPDAALGFSRLEKFISPYGNKSVTAEEWYGTAGMRWVSSNYAAVDGQCFVGIQREISGQISGLWWSFVVLIGSIGLNIFEFATSISAFDFFIDTIEAVVKSLNSTLYLQFLMPIVMLGAIWMGWQGLVKRRSSQAVQGAIWMIGATAAAAIFFAQPGAIAKQVNGLVTGVQDILIETVAYAGTAGLGSGGGPCGLDVRDSPEKMFFQNDKSVRVTKCALWYTFLFTPWAEGQFGPARGQVTVEKFYPAKGGDAVFFGEGAPMPTIGGGSKGKPLSGFAKPGQKGIPVEWLQLDSFTYNHDETIRHFLSGEGVFIPAGIVKTNQWHGVSQRFARSPSGQGAEANLRDWETEEDWISPPGTFQWSNADTLHRFLVALIALVAMIAGAGPVMFISLILVIQEIGFIFLIFFTPVFLLIGVHPGVGRRIALNWVEQILSLSLKRIGNALVLGVLLTMIAAIIGAAGSAWFIQILLIACVSAAAIVFRKRIVDGISQVNLGGTGGDYNQQATGALKQGTSKAVNSAAGTATSLAGGQQGGMGGGGGGLVNTVLGGALAGAGGAAVLSATRNRDDSKRISRKDQKKENEYKEWYDNSVVGQAEMDEYNANKEQKLREKEAFAMEQFDGSEDQVRGWAEWATKQGTKMKDGTFIPRAIPRPEDPALAQILRDAGLTLHEDIEDAADKIYENAKANARINADGKSFIAPVERPVNNPVMEARLKKNGVLFSDSLQQAAEQWKDWSVSGPGGESSPRSIPANATQNPHFKEILEGMGVKNFEDSRPAPGRHAKEGAPTSGFDYGSGNRGRHRKPERPDHANTGNA